jgi:hypothetical protein
MATKTAPAPSSNGTHAPTDSLPQFKRFDRHTAQPMYGNRAGVCMTMSRSGAFSISAELAEKLQLRPGAGITLLHDTTQEQWYIQRDDAKGLPVRADAKNRWLFNSSTIRRAITATLPDEEESGRIPVGEPVKVAGITLWPLMTSGIKQQRRKG